VSAHGTEQLSVVAGRFSSEQLASRPVAGRPRGSSSSRCLFRLQTTASFYTRSGFSGRHHSNASSGALVATYVGLRRRTYVSLRRRRRPRAPSRVPRASSSIRRRGRALISVTGGQRAAHSALTAHVPRRGHSHRPSRGPFAAALAGAPLLFPSLRRLCWARIGVHTGHRCPSYTSSASRYRLPVLRQLAGV